MLSWYYGRNLLTRRGSVNFICIMYTQNDCELKWLYFPNWVLYCYNLYPVLKPIRVNWFIMRYECRSQNFAYTSATWTIEFEPFTLRSWEVEWQKYEYIEFRFPSVCFIFCSETQSHEVRRGLRGIHSPCSRRPFHLPREWSSAVIVK
jgi:hypothetical protein